MSGSMTTDRSALSVAWRGLVRREATENQQVGASRSGGAVANAPRAPKERPQHGEKLCRRLTARRTAAVQIELVKQANVALGVLMQRMIPLVFDEVYARSHIDHAVKIDLHTPRDAPLPNAGDMAESVAWKALEGERTKWARMLPRRAEELLLRLLERSDDVMSNLFAFCVAATVDGISSADRPHAVNEVTNTLEVDLSRYWKPTRAGYFAHVAKDRIAAVVCESVSPQVAGELRSMKKDDAATAAELRMTDSGWLPEVLRNREVPERVTYGYDENDEEEDNENGDDAVAEADEVSEVQTGAGEVDDEPH
jgi:ParB family transcriptional regulator, chromosome partitioning protein